MTDRPSFIENRLLAWFDEETVKNVNSKVNEGWSENIPKESYRDASIVLSSLPNGKHKPCIDLDLDCRLVPSRTEGHYHLYINKEVAWEDYLQMLRAMQRCGVVQKGFVDAAAYRKYTACRKPVHKDKE